MMTDSYLFIIILQDWLLDVSNTVLPQTICNAVLATSKFTTLVVIFNNLNFNGVG